MFSNIIKATLILLGLVLISLQAKNVFASSNPIPRVGPNYELGFVCARPRAGCQILARPACEEWDGCRWSSGRCITFRNCAEGTEPAPEQQIRCARPPERCNSQRVLSACEHWHGCRWRRPAQTFGDFCVNDPDCTFKPTGPTQSPTPQPPTPQPTPQPPTPQPTPQPPTFAPTTAPPTSSPTTLPPTTSPTLDCTIPAGGCNTLNNQGAQCRSFPGCEFVQGSGVCRFNVNRCGS